MQNADTYCTQVYKSSGQMQRGVFNVQDSNLAAGISAL